MSERRRKRYAFQDRIAGWKITISDPQQRWGYEDGPWKGLGSPLLVAADFYDTVSSFYF